MTGPHSTGAGSEEAAPPRTAAGPGAHPPARGHTFLCYARHDADFVLDLAARLEERGRAVWVDQWRLAPGQNWDAEIDAALKACDTLLIVLSPEAVASSEVRGELRSALNLGKRVVPVLYRPCEIPRQLQNTQVFPVEFGEMTEALVDALGDALDRASVPSPERWRDPRRVWDPLRYLNGRLRALGASALGGLLATALAGLLIEASYARLLGVRTSPSASRVVVSGLQFLLSLLWEALVLSLPACLVVLAVAFVHRAARKRFPSLARLDFPTRGLGRPGLLWAAQLAAYGFLFFVSLPAFPTLLPLADVAFGKGLVGARIDTLTRAGEHYRAVVLHVGSAVLLVAALEAWRRRLHRNRQYMAAGEALVSLGLALPLYLLVSAELVLLPIGHGLLKLPSRREYSAADVRFDESVSEKALRGRTLHLIRLTETSPYTLYCPEGAQVWVEDRSSVSFEHVTTGTLVQLLEPFRALVKCGIPVSAAQERAP
jgi:hypothetical protein